MRKYVVKLFSLISLVLLTITNTPYLTMAGNNVPAYKATTFDISVKPEYDDPRTLVIYSADLYAAGNETVKKDTPVSFIIPKGAEIGMACEINAQGGHDCQPYSSKDLGNDNVELSWKASKDIAPGQKYPVYLEFYYDSKAVAPNKAFTYNFSPTFNIDNLSVAITQPKAATNFQLNPATSNKGQDQDGLTTHSIQSSNKTPKDSIAINVSYTKNDNKPTFDKPQVGSQPANSPTTNSGNNWFAKPSVLIPLFLTLAIMAVLIVYAVKNPKVLQNQTPNYHSVKKPNNKPKTNNSNFNERKQLRQALLDGRISEETYKMLVAELED